MDYDEELFEDYDYENDSDMSDKNSDEDSDDDDDDVGEEFDEWILMKLQDWYRN